MVRLLNLSSHNSIHAVSQLLINVCFSFMSIWGQSFNQRPEWLNEWTKMVSLFTFSWIFSTFQHSTVGNLGHLMKLPTNWFVVHCLRQHIRSNCMRCGIGFHIGTQMRKSISDDEYPKMICPKIANSCNKCHELLIKCNLFFLPWDQHQWSWLELDHSCCRNENQENALIYLAHSIAWLFEIV